MPMNTARVRKGQAEIIGGMIILTILIALIIPVVINSFTDITRLSEDTRRAETRVDIKLKEKLSIAGISQEDIGPDLWPAIWVNNTGTVQVDLEYLYLIDIETGTIKAIIDLKKARPWNSPIINRMILNPEPGLIGGDPIPNNTAVPLKPGDSLFISFNNTHPALLNPETLVVRILSASGVLHPITGSGQGVATLVPATIGTEIGAEPWKGAFNPYAGFKLMGGEELAKNGKIMAFTPSIYVYTFYIDYNYSFIYDDEKYPGLYKIVMKVRESDIIGGCDVSSGDEVEIRGFMGTYYTAPGGTYISGYAAEIYVNGVLCRSGFLDMFTPTNSVDVDDFDGNSVNELVFFSYKNGPLFDASDPYANPDTDFRGDEDDDVLGWVYVAQRDISGQDFIRITGKVNYYWTMISQKYGPEKPYRDLRIFSVVVWEYDNATDTYILRHYKDYVYVSNKPYQISFSAVFPLDREKTYRIGVIFYDNYDRIDNPYESGNDDSWLEFTYALEYIIVEYGRYNPLFSITPPIYIVAIPDPDKIRNIGENDYMLAFNITNESLAKLMAQSDLLELVTSELEAAGINDYVLITSSSQLCTLLFGQPTEGLPETPPRGAVILWLQGDMSIDRVSDYCVDNADLLNNVMKYHWVFTQLSGEPLWGALSYFTSPLITESPDPLVANLTHAGITARVIYKAYLMPLSAEFVYTITVQDTACVYQNATFYENTTLTNPRYGSVALWAGCETNATASGLFVLVTTDIDWAGDGAGIPPASLVEIAVYSALEAYKALAG